VIGRHIVVRSQLGELWIGDLDGGVLVGAGWQKLRSPGFLIKGFAASGIDDELWVAARGPAGQVSIGASQSGGPVLWRAARAEDGWRPALDTDLAWARPQPGSPWLFASGVDGTVRVLAAAEGVWRRFGTGTPPQVQPPSRFEVACRVPGQIELFTQSSTDDLVWTWWS
jgi:hypothetical protein